MLIQGKVYYLTYLVEMYSLSQLEERDQVDSPAAAILSPPSY